MPNVTDNNEKESPKEPPIQWAMNFVRDLLDLKKGVDAEATIKEIKHNKSMSGANGWMLMCSIMIASIGLSQNSQAVIIGAMLISPLMAPILGIGLSFGINDMDSLRKALTHFGVAIVIALLTSTGFFLLLPIDTVTDQIMERTNPTILDILIGIFGGIAGIISIARKDLTTTLPGVAIATALMPPLCVTGFFLSEGQWVLASRAFYLFFLNTFFVSLATYAIVRFFRFPYKAFPDRGSRIKNFMAMGLISLMIIIPSILIFRGVLTRFQHDVSIDEFISVCLGDKEIYLDSYHFIDNETERTLYLKVYGNEINNGDLETYCQCLSDVGLEESSITIIPTSEVDLLHLRQLQADVRTLTEKTNVTPEHEHGSHFKYAEEVMMDSVLFLEMQDEIQVLFPEIEEYSLGEMITKGDDLKPTMTPTINVKWKGRNTRERRLKADTFKAYVQARMNNADIQIISYD